MMQGNLDIQVALVRITHLTIEILREETCSHLQVYDMQCPPVASPLRILRTALLCGSLCRPLDLKIFSLLPSTSHELKNSLRLFFRGNWCLKGLCLGYIRICLKILHLHFLFLSFMLLESCLQCSFFTPSIHFLSGNRKQPNLEALLYSEKRMPVHNHNLWMFPSTCQQMSLLKIELHFQDRTG